MLKITIISFALFLTSSIECREFASDSLQVDLNDILRADLMPTSFLMIGGTGGEGVTFHANSPNGFDRGTEEKLEADEDDEEISARQGGVELLPFPNPSASSPGVTLSKNDASYMDAALSTMRFHRNKLNEYLCNNFLASQILSNIMPGTANQTNFSNRLGLMPMPSNTINPRILVDVGSQGYKNWLEKTTAFERANQRGNSASLDDNRLSMGNLSSLSGGGDGDRRNDFYDYDDSEFMEGNVSGFAYQKPIDSQPNHFVQTATHQQEHPPIHQQQQPMNPYLAINHGIEDFKHQNTDGRRTIHKDYYAPVPVQQQQQHHPVETYLVHQPIISPVQQLYAPQLHVFASGQDEGFIAAEHDYHQHNLHDYKSSKALGLKEIFEIALTTLAFLAFGMFMLQVIMCITMDQHMDPSMVVTPMEGSAELDPVTEEVRKRRAVPVANVAKMNELSKIVLMSLDSSYAAAADAGGEGNKNGDCIFRTICEVNGNSRTTAPASSKYWIPLWGLGMTWLAPQLIKGQPRMNTILDGIKASVMGLGTANCKEIYSKCDFVANRRRRRRSAN